MTDTTRAAHRPPTPLLPKGDPRHGTYHGYRHFKCRCALCRRANVEEKAISQERSRARGLAPGDPRHGTEYGYNKFACRCDECRAANAAACRRRAANRAQASRSRGRVWTS